LKEFLQKDKGGLALILVERHSHGYILENMCLKEDISLDFIHGGTNLEYREESIRRFKSGETKCLIASKILNEGEDIPLLELVINAGGMSGERGIVQKTGRALRKDKTETKQRAIIVDFLDNEPYYLNSNSKKRMSKIEARHPGAAEIVGLEEVLERINE
jgi:superfamily II DNA or RNA helicase